MAAAVQPAGDRRTVPRRSCRSPPVARSRDDGQGVRPTTCRASDRSVRTDGTKDGGRCGEDLAGRRRARSGPHRGGRAALGFDRIRRHSALVTPKQALNPPSRAERPQACRTASGFSERDVRLVERERPAVCPRGPSAGRSQSAVEKYAVRGQGCAGLLDACVHNLRAADGHRRSSRHPRHDGRGEGRAPRGGLGGAQPRRTVDRRARGGFFDLKGVVERAARTSGVRAELRGRRRLIAPGRAAGASIDAHARRARSRSAVSCCRRWMAARG